MKKHKSSISQAASYKEIGEFWDIHDLSDFWDKTKEAQFDVDIAAVLRCQTSKFDLNANELPMKKVVKKKI